MYPTDNDEICVRPSLATKVQFVPHLQEVGRPGKKATDLSKKSRAEPRPPNEHHSVDVASGTVPHGLRMAPVGREETVKAAVVQAARALQPAQASDQGYATGTTNKRKTGTGTYTLHGCLVKKVIVNSFLLFSCVRCGQCA